VQVATAHRYRVFFSNSALYIETVMIFDELDLEDLALLVPCFKIEDNGLGLAAFTILPIDAVGVAEVETKVGKSGGATVDRLEELAHFKLNTTEKPCAE
jgi:hypothetical protein